MKLRPCDWTLGKHWRPPTTIAARVIKPPVVRLGPFPWRGEAWLLPARCAFQLSIGLKVRLSDSTWEVGFPSLGRKYSNSEQDSSELSRFISHDLWLSALPRFNVKFTSAERQNGPKMRGLAWNQNFLDLSQEGSNQIDDSG